jgi:hypothetical protein
MTYNLRPAAVFIMLLLVVGYWLLLTSPAHAFEIDVIKSPEATFENETIAEYIVRTYSFAVGAAGIVAVAVIVFGAIYYMVSSGSPDKQNDAKSYITSALWGVALLLGSYLILNTINPQLVEIDYPSGVETLTPQELTEQQQLAFELCAPLLDSTSEEYCKRSMTVDNNIGPFICQTIAGDQNPPRGDVRVACNVAREGHITKGELLQHPFYKPNEEPICYTYAFMLDEEEVNNCVSSGNCGTTFGFFSNTWKEKKEYDELNPIKQGWKPC